jgi:hypothetical protein
LGGSGGESLSEPGIRTTRLIGRALKERWDIPASLKKTLLTRMEKVANDPATSARELNVTITSVLQASRLNVEAIEAEVKIEEMEALRAELEYLKAEQSRDGVSPSRPDSPAEADPA